MVGLGGETEFQGGMDRRALKLTTGICSVPSVGVQKFDLGKQC